MNQGVFMCLSCLSTWVGYWATGHSSGQTCQCGCIDVRWMDWPERDARRSYG